MIEIPTYQPSEFERNALSHYKGEVSSKLEQTLRGATMVLHNILPELYSKGVRLRIVPHGTNLTDLPECIDLKVYKTKDGKNDLDACLGLYRRSEKLIIVKEKALEETSTNQKYPTLIHEFAHAIWDILLSPEERGYVEHLFEDEKKIRKGGEYRLSNTLEFFAESFRYYVTPQHKGSRIFNPMENFPIIHPGKEDLMRFNLKMFTFLHGKFGNIIDPTLLSGEKGDPFDYDRISRLYVTTIFFDPRKMRSPFNPENIKVTLVKTEESDKEL